MSSATPFVHGDAMIISCRHHPQSCGSGRLALLKIEKRYNIDIWSRRITSTITQLLLLSHTLLHKTIGLLPLVATPLSLFMYFSLVLLSFLAISSSLYYSFSAYLSARILPLTLAHL